MKLNHVFQGYIRNVGDIYQSYSWPIFKPRPCDPNNGYKDICVLDIGSGGT